MRSRNLCSLFFIGLFLVGTKVAAQGAPTPATSQWALWLSVLADAFKVAEIAVVMFGVYQFWASRGERREAETNAAALARKAANYQAWQVVNSSQGKGGSGGRIDALRDLTVNGVSLAGVHLDGAWLEGVNLADAKLAHATFVKANLQGAVFEHADLQQADFTDANLVGARLSAAVLKGANLTGAQLSTADLRGADLSDLRGWERIRSISYANIMDVRNAPAGFQEWAIRQGAQQGDEEVAEGSEQSFSASWRVV